MEAFIITSTAGFAVMAAYIVAMLAKHGIQATVSDNFYVSRHKWLFSAATALYALLSLPAMLEAGGVQCLAFLAAAGLMLVAAEPHFHSPWGRKLHIGGAVAALACGLAWACTVQWEPVVLTAVAYLYYAVIAWRSDRPSEMYTLYIGECAAVLAIFIALLCGLQQ